MAKMLTLEQLAVGVYNWEDDGSEQARIERNRFALNGRTWEALRFCKNRNGRHNRVHLVIEEEHFVDLFRDAVQNGVFSAETLTQLRRVLGDEKDPFLKVVGLVEDGTLTSSIDDELYGERTP